MTSHVMQRISRYRWMVFVCTLVLTATFLQPVQSARGAQAGAGPVPGVTAGPGPVDRPAPASARPDGPVPEEKLAPPVPAGVPAQGAPEQLPAERWAEVPGPGESAPGVAVDDQVFTNVLLRPGYVLGDTSLVAYFDVRDEDPAWSSWKVRLYDAESETEQASVSLQRSELDASCGAVREYCRSLGAAEKWALDAAKEYYITIAAVFDDGREVVSGTSDEVKPRTTMMPPPIPAKQAAGCGCGSRE